jgi:hypothetical protein
VAPDQDPIIEGGVEIVVHQMDFLDAKFFILGTSPLLYNRMSEKARQQLLLPRGRMNSAEKQMSVKHVPLEEYQNSIYKWRADDGASRFKFPANAFKKAVATAALDTPGATKAQVSRIVQAQWRDVDVFGIPQLFMSVVRQAGFQKTPDIRTRGILPEWCTSFTLRYPKQLMNFQSLATLVGISGVLTGIGDGRPEKGCFSFGQFETVPAGDPRWEKIAKHQGRAAQDVAFAKPGFYDEDSEDLYTWYYAERQRRGRDSDGPTKRRKKGDEAILAFSPPAKGGKHERRRDEMAFAAVLNDDDEGVGKRKRGRPRKEKMPFVPSMAGGKGGNGRVRGGARA